VSSSHYLAEAGKGLDLFMQFSMWLRPGGALFLLGPRAAAETPCWPLLTKPPLRSVFRQDELRQLCRQSRLEIVVVRPAITQLGTFAKQLACSAGRSAFLRALSYPVQIFATALDRYDYPGKSRAGSFAWLLVARKVMMAFPTSSGPQL
jgi:hypothetical protein